MKIGRILYPVHVLGPGKRVGIWMAGCDRHCPGCANPELWEAKDEQEISPADCKQLLQQLYCSVKGEIDGFTISGGEPFLQKEELYELVLFLRTISEDILVFSGYTGEEWQADETAAGILDNIAVLVDGDYREQENLGEILRGSANQRIYYRNPDVAALYERYLKEHEGQHMVETFQVSDGIVAVGIHKKDFRVALQRQLEKKQLERLEE